MLPADRGQHRAPSIPDLLIAATAEKAALTVLAADKDFDLIATTRASPSPPSTAEPPPRFPPGRW